MSDSQQNSTGTARYRHARPLAAAVLALSVPTALAPVNAGPNESSPQRGEEQQVRTAVHSGEFYPADVTYLQNVLPMYTGARLHAERALDGATSEAHRQELQPIERQLEATQRTFTQLAGKAADSGVQAREPLTPAADAVWPELAAVLQQLPQLPANPSEQEVQAWHLETLSETLRAIDSWNDGYTPPARQANDEVDKQRLYELDQLPEQYATVNGLLGRTPPPLSDHYGGRFPVEPTTAGAVHAAASVTVALEHARPTTVGTSSAANTVVVRRTRA